MESVKDWKTATDAKTGRTYWYHRKTRVSTWKKPDFCDEIEGNEENIQAQPSVTKPVQPVQKDEINQNLERAQSQQSLTLKRPPSMKEKEKEIIVEKPKPRAEKTMKIIYDEILDGKISSSTQAEELFLYILTSIDSPTMKLDLQNCLLNLLLLCCRFPSLSISFSSSPTTLKMISQQWIKLWKIIESLLVSVNPSQSLIYLVLICCVYCNLSFDLLSTISSSDDVDTSSSIALFSDFITSISRRLYSLLFDDKACSSNHFDLEMLEIICNCQSFDIYAQRNRKGSSLDGLFILLIAKICSTLVSCV
jgi:hypothetical protein